MTPRDIALRIMEECEDYRLETCGACLDDKRLVDAIERAVAAERERVCVLEKAAQPFVKAAHNFGPEWDGHEDMLNSDIPGDVLLVDDFRALARARRIWQLMGGTKLHTYTLQRESGDSMRGAGLKAPVAEIEGAQWDRPARPRMHKAIHVAPKVRWTETLASAPP